MVAEEAWGWQGRKQDRKRPRPLEDKGSSQDEALSERNKARWSGNQGAAQEKAVREEVQTEAWRPAGRCWGAWQLLRELVKKG